MFSNCDYKCHRRQTEACDIHVDAKIYEDGDIISKSLREVLLTIELLHRGSVVSLVTAAENLDDSGRYETRLRGILDALEDVTTDERVRFLVMGGELSF